MGRFLGGGISVYIGNVTGKMVKASLQYKSRGLRTLYPKDPSS